MASAVLSVPTWATDVLRLLRQQGLGMASTQCGGPRLPALVGQPPDAPPPPRRPSGTANKEHHMSSKPLGCMRCATAAPLTPQGRLWLCAPCATDGVPSACDPSAHVWRGHADGWVCLTCGQLLTAETPAPPAGPPTSWDC